MGLYWRAPAVHETLILPCSILQSLLLLWFVVEDHDTLFILSESVHFLGIGLLAYKLIKKRGAGGAPLPSTWPLASCCLLPVAGETILFHSTVRRLSCRPASRRACCRPVAADAGADGGVLAGAPLLLLHDGVRHPHAAGLPHPRGHRWAASQQPAELISNNSPPAVCDDWQRLECMLRAIAVVPPSSICDVVVIAVLRCAAGWVIFSLRGPLKESYQSDLDVTNPLLVAAPCLAMALIAHPSTRHYFVFRVRETCRCSSLTVHSRNLERSKLWSGTCGARWCVQAAAFLSMTAALPSSCLAHAASASAAPCLGYSLLRAPASSPFLAGAVGLLRVPGGRERAAAATHDAEGKGGGEVHGALRLCAGPLALHLVRALDPPGQLPTQFVIISGGWGGWGCSAGAVSCKEYDWLSLLVEQLWCCLTVRHRPHLPNSPSG